MEKFVFLCIFLVGTFLKLSNGQVTCNNKYTDADCNKWQRLGYCTHTWVEYMKKNCMKACRYCATTSPANTGTGVTCNNKYTDADCGKWRRLGYCTHTYVQYMQKWCMKSCGTGNCAAATANATTTTKAPVCGKLPAKQCYTGQVCNNPDTPSAKCGAPVCGKLPAKQCYTGQVCRNPDTPCAKCEAPVCGKLPAKQCYTGQVCSNPDTPSAKCGAAVCGIKPAKQCTTHFEQCINPDTPSAKCEFLCGASGSVCSAAAFIRTPLCLDVAGNTPTYFTLAAATCKCTTTSCLTYNTRSQQTSPTPVCGTSSNGALLPVNGAPGVGVCQGCRMGNNGLQPASTNTGAGVAGFAPTRANSTCPAGLGCCASGHCVAKICPPNLGVPGG